MPIKEEITVVKEEKKEFEALAKDVYNVQLVDVVIDIVEKYQKKDEFEKTFTFLFAVNEEQNNGRWVTVRYIPTYLFIGKNGKNKLYNILEALLGRNLSQEEEATGINTSFLNSLIGEQCRLGVDVTEKGGNTVDGFYPCKSKLEKIPNSKVLEMQTKFEELRQKWSNNKKEAAKEVAAQEQTVAVDEEIPVIQIEEDEIRIEDVPF